MYLGAKRFPLSKITLILLASLSVANVSSAQSNDEEAIEEVVTKGTRLKGTATAVIEERKNQAFVADILGADQISRTGDGDAASALRRVTGLTLVDGKFIYVRGLGERYSSTSLNSSAVPSPDPTRNVIPLDLFPADIIESLSVQKSYSPSMPASFGGGNVDIRLKSIPTQEVFNMSLGTGYNADNASNGLTYTGGNSDWRGKDDGTRAAPALIQERWGNKVFLDDLDPTFARDLLVTVKRSYDPIAEAIGPDGSFNFTYGNSYDITDKWRLGFLLANGYDSSTRVTQQYELQQADRIQDEIELVRFFDDISSTETTVQWSNLFTLGVDYNRNHQVDYSLIVLSDTRDEIREQFGNTENLSLGENLRIRDVVVEYEERKMFTNQIKGKHTFPQYNFLGFDWRYSLGRSSRNAPGNFESRFIVEDANFDGVFDTNTEISLTNAPTAGRYSFQNLHDRLENFGYNVTYPLSIKNWEMEFKFGADFVTKARTAQNRRFDINTRAFVNSDILEGNTFSTILSNDVLQNAELSGNAVIRDTTISGDDYVAGQKIDAYYVESDFFYKNQWRFTGGVRFEDFRQVVAPFDPRTNKFDLTENGLEELAFQESDFYPALALTYMLNDSMQFRSSIGQTVVRPDLREVSSATYIDPLTGFPIAGTPGVKTTSITNLDLRWEWYREAGNNISVGLFYKDMENPIESVQSPAQDGPPLIRIANAESGFVYGVEMEFLQGLDIIGDGVWDNLFASGNITLSDSEIVLDRQSIVELTGVSAAITNTTRRLTGHSQFVANLQLGFDSDNGEHSASFVYNVFGERILIPGIDGFEDNFEQPFHSFDTVYKYYPNFNTTITFKIQNMLDQKKKLEFEDVLLRSETRGRGFSLSVKYDFK
jgi:outer membrane receptor protein involved in Fe transport